MAVREWALGVAAALALAIAAPAQSTSPKNLAIGKLLVANRNLRDPNFYHTVVLLVIYQNDAVVGLVLNRSSRVSVSAAFDVREAKGRPDPVYRGGPVEPSSTYALLRASSRPQGSTQVLGDVSLIAAESVLRRTMASPVLADSFRIYVGYAGWTARQLQDEVATGSWYIFPGDAKTIFDPEPQSLWDRLIERTGGLFALRTATGLL
jgi:putative transcriptional regulator